MYTCACIRKLNLAYANIDTCETFKRSAYLCAVCAVFAVWFIRDLTLQKKPIPVAYLSPNRACAPLLSTEQLLEFWHLTNKCFDEVEMPTWSKYVHADSNCWPILGVGVICHMWESSVICGSDLRIWGRGWDVNKKMMVQVDRHTGIKARCACICGCIMSVGHTGAAVSCQLATQERLYHVSWSHRHMPMP